MLIFSPNLIDVAALTPGTQDPEFPASFLQVNSPSWVWKTLGTVNAESLLIDLGSAQAVSSFIVHAHNFDGTETGVTLQGNSSNSWGSPAFSLDLTSLVTPGKTFGSVNLGTMPGGPYRYWRFIFTKANATDIRQIGRLSLGPSITPAMNPDYDGMQITPVDPSTVDRSMGGVRFTERKPSWDTVQFKYSYMPQALYDTLDALYTALGMSTPFFIQVGNTAPMNALSYMAFASAFPRAIKSFDGQFRWASNINIEEPL